jgi:DNA mismatch repair protein MSH2
MSVTNSSSSSSSSWNPKTTVAIWISKTLKSGGATTSDPYHSQRLQVVVWACRRRQRTDSATNTHTESNSAAPPGHVLEYYQFWDHPSRWDHLDALLTRLAPLEAIHVGAGDKLSTPPGTVTPKKGKQSSSSSSSSAVAARRLPKALERLLELLQDRQDWTEMSSGDTDNITDTNTTTAAAAAAAATMSAAPVLWHDDATIGSVDKARLDSVVTQLLPDKSAVLSYQGDTQLSGDSVSVKGLVFYLQATGLWSSKSSALMDGSSSIINNCIIQSGVLDSHLVLDRTAAAAIHLWPPENAGQAVVVGGSSHNNSLYGLLAAACRTIAGKRLLELWLRQPLTCLKTILARQNAVATLVQHGVGRDAIREQGLQTLASTDLPKLAAHLSQYQQEQDDGDANAGDAPSKGMGSTRSALQGLYQLYMIASQKIPLVTEHLQALLLMQQDTPSTSTGDHENGNVDPMLSELLDGFTSCNAELQRSVGLVEAVLDLNQAPREYLVRASYKEELGDIQAELDQLDNDLEECHKEMNETWAQASGTSNNNNAVRLERCGENDMDWQFRLPDTNDSKILQNQLGSTIKIHRVLKNGVYFSTKELRQLACKKQDLVAEYDRHQRQVVMDAMKVAATYQPVLERASELVATLDVIAGLAHVAAYSPHGYCRPTMTDGEEDGLGIDLKGARHPCVEMQENMEYIPNDIRLIFGESSFLLVTGPNMGGKSTYIRALGAIVTLAQIGSYVPCTSATVNICHHILARVGAGDLQERGISTFMAEMLESSSILRTASKRSIIIIDELGRGTSTFDGYGLARAISEYIVQKIGCMTVFATHFHELTALEDHLPEVKNCHVTAQKGNHGLTFLYEVKPGPCLESFGIQVAEMANVPAVVIQDAKRKARELENFEYRKKSREAHDSDQAVGVVMDHAAAEEAAAAVDFVNRFRRMPLQSTLSNADKQAALLQLLEGQ